MEAKRGAVCSSSTRVFWLQCMSAVSVRKGDNEHADREHRPTVVFSKFRQRWLVRTREEGVSNCQPGCIGLKYEAHFPVWHRCFPPLNDPLLLVPKPRYEI